MAPISALDLSDGTRDWEAGMADQDGLVVRDVAVRPVVVPLRRPLATKVGDFSQWPLLLIDVATEQGIVGRGYLGPYLSRAAAAGRAIRALPWPRWPASTSRCGMRWPRRPACRWPGCLAAHWPRFPPTTA